MDGNADLAEMMQNQFSDNDDIAELVEEEAPKEKEEDWEMIETGIDPDEWARECQWVAHKLKIGKNLDVKEWWSHLDQTKKYAETVKSNLPDVRMKLEKVSDEVSRALEKISKKEAMLNKGMAGMTGNYKSTSGTLKQLTDEHNKIKSHIEEMEA